MGREVTAEGVIGGTLSLFPCVLGGAFSIFVPMVGSSRSAASL